MERIIVWRLTQTCNMRCLFCSYSYELERPRNDANVSGAKRLIEILGQYARQKNRKVLVSWIGGEPFLYEPIFDLSNLLDTRHGIKSSTTTNASHYTQLDFHNVM